MAKRRGISFPTYTRPPCFSPLFVFCVNRLRHVHPTKRQQALVARVELIVVLEDELHQLVTVDEAKVALGLRKARRLAGEGAERDHQSKLAGTDLAIERGARAAGMARPGDAANDGTGRDRQGPGGRR